MSATVGKDSGRAGQDPGADTHAARVLRWLRSSIPQGGSLPDDEWRTRHRLICSLLWISLAIVPIYAITDRGLPGAIRYAPATASIVAFAWLAEWPGSRKWRSLSASMGLLAASATVIDISGGLIEMHFSFFVVIVVLTLYEDWLPFLVAVGFVLIHHGVMGMLDPRAVFGDQREWGDPWAWAALHAGFIALAGIAGITAWGFNERVRQRMRETQTELERIGLTDPLTGLGNRRHLMGDLQSVLDGGDPAALTIFDLDGFKDYNDRFGHPAGDSLLVRLTSVLDHSLRSGESAYRLGGDEFCVLARSVTREELDQRLDRWSAGFTESGEGFMISASSGTAMLPADAHDPSEALRVCDGRMYALKHGRRGTTASQIRDALLAALAARHTQLGDHVTGVGAVAERVGVELGLSASELQELRYAAELHDIGKVAIPDSILAKPGPLNEPEWEFMRRHTIIGERILAAAPSLSTVARIVRATHERVDGTGYPDRLGTDAIPLAARIISVCDAYDAMTASRPYRRSVTHSEALAELERCAGQQFDARVVAAFIRAYPETPPAPGQTPLRAAPMVRFTA